MKFNDSIVLFILDILFISELILADVFKKPVDGNTHDVVEDDGSGNLNMINDIPEVFLNLQTRTDKNPDNPTIDDFTWQVFPTGEERRVINCDGLNGCQEFGHICEEENKTCAFDTRVCKVVCACPENTSDCKSLYIIYPHGNAKQLNDALITTKRHPTISADVSLASDSEPTPTCVPSTHTSRQTCPTYFPDCIHGTCIVSPVEDEFIFDMVCKCASGWTEQSCNTCCPLECKHGNCEIHNATMACHCEWGFTGKLCEEEVVPNQNSKKHIHVVVICGIITGIFSLSVFVTIYLMWYNRVHIILKIVHIFKPFEDNKSGEYEYDAFISYKGTSDDERWVVTQLYPHLENQMNFKLCLHFRDFIVGDTIVNNIIRAVEKSRRTILVLTPNYVQSEWTRFEYQKAQHQMLRLKHRIIPVILKEIGHIDNIDPNLRHILNTITYIKWPVVDNQKKKMKFWDKLRLSMPKKGPSHSADSSRCRPVLSASRKVSIESLHSSPYSTIASRHHQFGSKQPSIRSTVSSIIIPHKNNLNVNFGDPFQHGVPTQHVSNTSINTHDGNDNEQVPNQNTESDPFSKPIVSLTMRPVVTVDKPGNVVDLSESKLPLLELSCKTSTKETMQLKTGNGATELPTFIIDGSSSPTADSICCTFV